VWTSPDRTLRAARSPVVIVLVALAILAVSSAAWTIGEPGDALRYGLVIAGYAALAVTAAAAPDRVGRSVVYATIVALAAISGLIGLVGAGAQEFPFGQRVGGSWEAGGTFEYGPANALLQVAALPILLTVMCGGSRTLALASAAGIAIASAVVALSDSLFCELAAAALLVLAVAFPAATIHRSRTTAAAAALLAGAAAFGAHLVAGRYTPPCEIGGDGARLAALAAIVIAAPAVWALARRALLAERTSRFGPLSVLAAAAAIAIGGGIADPEGSCSAPTEGVEPYAGVLHGRIALWEAAYDAALDHPVAGSGADTYGLASSPYQEGDHVLYAHDLPLELWTELGIAGAALVIALYLAAGSALAGARRSDVLWLAGTAVAAFMLANLIDFPWHLAGAGAVWALALGVVIGVGGDDQTRGVG
jgi:O-antigen ligase